MSEKRDTNLSRLGLSELQALRDRIDAEIQTRRRLGERVVRQRGGLVERDGPRYQNPENSAETWSGRGTRPAWLERALARGLTLQELEIIDDRPTRTPGEP